MKSFKEFLLEVNILGIDSENVSGKDIGRMTVDGTSHQIVHTYNKFVDGDSDDDQAEVQTRLIHTKFRDPRTDKIAISSDVDFSVNGRTGKNPNVLQSEFLRRNIIKTVARHIMHNVEHMKSMGLEIGRITYDTPDVVRHNVYQKILGRLGIPAENRDGS